MLSFSWDPNKNLSNIKKHGVSFEEALTVFFDEDAIFSYDTDHSETEDRYLLLGISAKARLLVVVHCMIRNDNVIRLISARKATKNESTDYLELNQGVNTL